MKMIPLTHSDLGPVDLDITSGLIRRATPRANDPVEGYRPRDLFGYLHVDVERPMSDEQRAMIDDYVVQSHIEGCYDADGQPVAWQCGASLKTGEQLARIEAAKGAKIARNF